MRHGRRMDGSDAIDRIAALEAFAARDATRDGAFVVCVTTTRIYCRPSCPARRPRAEHVEILADGEEARAAGYRPCLRCRPDEARRDHVAVERALAIIGEAENRVGLAELAAVTGYSPAHFQRIFKHLVGISPAAYARRLRGERLTRHLKEERSVTDAIYAAGYESPARAFAEAGEQLGMTPGRWKDGGAGEVIRFAVADSALGPVLVAATERGLCRIAFDEGEEGLRARFPRARIMPGDEDFRSLVSQVVEAIAVPGAAMDLPLDVRGTAFQQAVWQALRSIPAGETRSYAELAAMVGRPGAVRAAGSACGANALAVAIPCHRVLRTDGSLGGYAYGLERKECLLAAERGDD